MSFVEAFKGGMAEIRDCPDLPSRVSTAARHARLIAEEFAGQLALVPFAVRALSERRRARRDGRLVEGVRYGPRARQVADIWLPPPQEKTSMEKKERSPAIAVLFHGGTWTAGDKWNVGPCCLALADRCRCLVVAPNYSVYSAREGLGIAACVEDAVDAVRWAGTPAAAAAAEAAAPTTPTTAGEATALPPPSHSHGGDPTRLAVLGHSAGAHLAVAAAMILAAERDREEEEMEQEWKKGAKEGEKSRRERRRHSLPSAVVSLAGPFDLPSHFEHEAKRGVHRLSTMARAAATPRSFALEAAERSTGKRRAVGSSSSSNNANGGASSSSSSSSSSSFFDAAPELHRASLAALSPLACLDPGASLAGLRPASGPLCGVAAAAAAAEGEEEARKGGRRAGKSQREQQRTRYLFLSSAADVVVPPTSSRALHAALLARRQEGSGRGVESRHVEYSSDAGEKGGRGPVGHADFVVRSWRVAEGGSGEEAPWAAEVEAVVSSL